MVNFNFITMFFQVTGVLTNWEGCLSTVGLYPMWSGREQWSWHTTECGLVIFPGNSGCRTDAYQRYYQGKMLFIVFGSWSREIKIKYMLIICFILIQYLLVHYLTIKQIFFPNTSIFIPTNMYHNNRHFKNNIPHYGYFYIRIVKQARVHHTKAVITIQN